MKLHYKLYMFFAAVVILPLLVATLAASLVLGRSGTENYENRIRSGLAAASAIFSGQAQILSGDFQAASGTADAAALASGDPGRTTVALTALAERARVAGAMVVDSDGNTVAVVGESPDTAAPMLASSTQITGPGGAMMRLTVYRPLDTGPLDSVFSSQSLDWALLDGGVVAQGTLPAGSEITGGNGRLTGQSAPPETDEFMEAALYGREMLASTLPVPRDVTTRAAVLFAGIDRDVVGAASAQALEAGIILMLLVAVLAATLGFLLARTITSPLRKLNEAALAGIEGNLERRVEVSSSDELGSLASSFNLMQESLQSHIGELEESRTQLLLALSYAGDILGSTTDRKRLVKTTADAARLATGADGIWVELLESSEPPGHKAVYIGVPDDLFTGDIRQAVRDLAMSVANGRVAAGEPVSPASGKEMLAYPMVHDRKTLGTLIAVYDAGRPLEESRRRILSSLALQAGSAIENVNFGDLQRMLAITDSMTGLYNFRYLTNSIEAEIKKSRRYGRQLSVAIIDLDDFKLVNDNWGHPAGDALLKAVAQVLLANVRASDMVARYGGEEFAVVFTETSKKAAMSVAEKLRKGIARVRLADYPDVAVTASIGVASFPGDAESRESLLKSADDALYRAKKRGKNQVVDAPAA